MSHVVSDVVYGAYGQQSMSKRMREAKSRTEKKEVASRKKEVASWKKRSRELKKKKSRAETQRIQGQCKVSFFDQKEVSNMMIME